MSYTFVLSFSDYFTLNITFLVIWDHLEFQSSFSFSDSASWLDNINLGTDLLEVFFTPARFVGKIWSGLATCPPSASPTTGEPTTSPTQAPTTAYPTRSPSMPPTPFPSVPPTPAPTKVNSMTVGKNELVMNFYKIERRRNLRTLLLRTLQGCLNNQELEFANSMLEQHIKDMYAQSLQGAVTVPFASIKITDHIDLTLPGDCSKIKFIYDQEMVLNTVGDDETTVTEIIQLPLESADDRQKFVNDLTSSTDAGKFGYVSGVEPIVVTQEGLSTRTPTSPPSISTSPTESPTGTLSGYVCSMHCLFFHPVGLFSHRCFSAHKSF